MAEVFAEITNNDYNIVFRKAEEADIYHIGKMIYEKVFPDKLPEESLEKEIYRWNGRFKTFKDGIIVAEDVKKKRIIAAHGAQILKWNYGDSIPSTWSEMTDNGAIKASHNPGGNTYHVVTNVVDMDYAKGSGIGSKLLGIAVDIFKKTPKMEHMIVGHTLGRSNEDEYNRFKRYLGNVQELDANELKKKLMHWAEMKEPNPKTNTAESVDGLVRFYGRAGFKPLIPLINWEGYPEYDFCILEVLKKV